jgi:hypothetical protein
MATERDYQDFFDRLAALEESAADSLASQLIQHPELADDLNRQLEAMIASIEAADATATPPPDLGVAQLAGIGPQAAATLGDTRTVYGIAPYDETINSERITAVGDIYYLYQHERIGVFRVVQKLQQLFRAGTVMLSSGPGAYGLYKFDRRQVLRYTQRDRYAAYRRVLGYGGAPVPAGSRENSDFHRLFAHFNNQVALYWRDKRISDVLRERAYDPSFGSIAVVRRSGLDLRNNLKHTSYGNLNVMRVEVMQLLDEAFSVLGSPDVMRLFGADNAWDVVESVLVHYFNERLQTSPRQRMAVAGRNVIRWLAQPHILTATRAQFEALLLEIAEPAEEWLTSAQSVGVADRPTAERRVLPWDRRRVGVMTPRTEVVRGTQAAQQGNGRQRAPATW